jgi:hypothetical protein
MVPFRKWIILTHRWLGIAVGFFFVLWFASGIGMVFTGGMPALIPVVRLQRLPDLNLGAVHLTASEAAEKALIEEPPERLTLLTIMDRPAYRFTTSEPVIVFADTGETLSQITETQAIRIAARFVNIPEGQLHHAATLRDPDQWTIESGDQLPLHKIVAGDAAHTQLYVSEKLGEVVLETTRRSRALAWVAAIPHWLYFAPLRLKGDLWRQVVLWTSGAGIVLAAAGIIVGIIQFSRSRRPRIPYAGLMRWHYLTGAIFGVFALTWVLSGMLSMEPWFWASGGGSGRGISRALSGGPLVPALFPPIGAMGWNRVLNGRPVKELEFLRIQGDPYYALRGADENDRVLVAARPLAIRTAAFPIDRLLNRIKVGNPSVPIIESALLAEFDSYYYSRDDKPPLPVLRVKFDDPDRTWFYVDPGMSRVVARFTRRQRIQRWVYTGLHDLDFAFWYYNGAAWQFGMVVLNVGGVLLSSLGFYAGLKRLMRYRRHG